MKTKRTTRTFELTVETDELLVARSAYAPPPGLCPECGARTLRPEAAAALAGVSVREVYRRVETGRAHFAESPGGQVFVCPDSLA